MIPYLLAGLSLLIAGGVHWYLAKVFWKATLLSTVTIVVLSLLFIFVFQADYMGLDKSTNNNGTISDAFIFVTGLISFFALLISLLVGYFLKALR